ncbi:type III PLP-dependent enzyme domain-containing protein [Nonomuraea turcica]|uniref:type III PLP-dependent enzyme n=2 Tax=unclassified Nonomuraea TaxID=2593643 RepID=UPI00273BBD39|nr:type III PLP-dependent enzyme [Nonomuraea sp. G32]MDP4510597.1 type III PLP-dependent enzyme [Nonomuraea sp. G32]
MIPARVQDAASGLTAPAYVYDLPALEAHVAAVRQALPGIELYYAVKANPDAELLRVLAGHVDGFEVSSGGEHAHVTGLFPGVSVALGGPGKTDAELRLPHHRIHVESPNELRRLLATGLEADVLIRVNPDLPVEGAALTMSGPFGMDEEGVKECLPLFGERVRLRGLHTHLASGLDAAQLLRLAGTLLDNDHEEVNLGGGMAVSYESPESRFDWATYGAGLAELRRGRRLRIEPGRALTAYCGYYVTRVVDVKRVRGEAYAIVLGGTHHLRTPVTKGHDQPFAILPMGTGPGVTDEPITFVGQLCTPKDVFARKIATSARVGDMVVFEMAGAYAWNISHHDFLMHPKPAFHYLSGCGPVLLPSGGR